jgi:hypothetical protein
MESPGAQDGYFGSCLPYSERAVTFMMLMYALERRGRAFILAFACGCALSSVYGFLAGTWPFGVVEAIWAAIALHRYVQMSSEAERRSAGTAEPRSVSEPEHERARAIQRH